MINYKYKSQKFEKKNTFLGNKYNAGNSQRFTSNFCDVIIYLHTISTFLH